MFLAGDDGSGTVKLWRELHAADPQLLLLGASSMSSESFTSQIGAAGAQTYLATPVLPLALYPPLGAARAAPPTVATFTGEAGPWVLYGYEAMSAVLDAIRSAGVHGNDRRAVVERFFATRERDSVIGRYSIEPNGETTLSTYGVDRVLGGRAVFYRAITVPPSAEASSG